MINCYNLSFYEQFVSYSGLVVNGVYIFEQIANGEERRVSYIGNVVMGIRPLRNFQRFEAEFLVGII